MKSYIQLLLILILLTNVNGGILYARFIDLTGDDLVLIDQYQFDNNSNRYIKTMEINETIYTIGTDYSYKFVILPTRKSIMDDVTSENQLSFLYREVPLWIFIVAGFGLLILIISKRGNFK